jgi:hypothetical protein
MMDDDAILAVVQAHKEGKKIQVLAIHSDLGWQDCDNPSWNFATSRYRVDPEPRKPREWILVLDDNGKIKWGHVYDSQFMGDEKCVRVREVLE